MDCACALSWIRSACRSRGLIAWKLGLAHRVLWALRDRFWDSYLCCRAIEPLPMVGLEGPIEDVVFFRKFPEGFRSGLALKTKKINI
jgi:hypothetical protein